MTYCPGCSEDHTEIHPQVFIQYGNQSANVDQKLAPLLLEMWKHGIQTLYSCQDEGESAHKPELKGWGSIQLFPQELIKFLDLIKMETKELGLPDDPFRPFPFSEWKWEMYPSRARISGVWETALMTSAIFPMRQLDLIIKLMNRKKS